MKLRGDPVAVILADYRMPEMNGIEFLEQAMDLFPRARRVLLTAYADTDAAIEAINVVDLDHYLLKPWDPPEEKLYPVVDALLDAWRPSDDRRRCTETKVVGHRWSAPSFEVRDFLARNQVPYRWYSADEPEGQRLLEAAGADGADAAGGDHPGRRAAGRADRRRAGRARSGLSTTPGDRLLRPGRGRRRPGRPRRRGVRRLRGAAHRAGRAAARPAARPARARGSRTTSASRTGCPARSSPTGPGGRPRSSAPRSSPRGTSSAWRSDGSARVVRFADGGDDRRAHGHPGHRGLLPASWSAPGVADLTGRGVYYGSALDRGAGLRRTRTSTSSAARTRPARPRCSSPGYAKSVTLVVRGDVAGAVDVALPDRADRAASTNIAVRTCTEVVEAHGDDHLERPDAARHRHRADARRSTPATLFVFIGAQPRTDWLDGVVVRDDRGFVLTGPDLLGRRRAAARLAAGPGPVPPGDQRARGVRGRRRAGASRPSGSPRPSARARMAVIARPPLPGDAMTVSTMPTGRADRRATSCATLFLFERLDDEQLGWLCRARPGGASCPAGARRAARGRPGDLLLRAARRHDRDDAAGSARTTSRSTAPTSAASYAGAPSGLPRRPVPTGLHRDRAGDHRAARFFVLAAADFARADARLVPDGDAPAGGPVLRDAELAADRRPAGAAAGPRLAVGRPDPRAEQPGGGRGPGHRGAARPGRRDAAQAGACSRDGRVRPRAAARR